MHNEMHQKCNRELESLNDPYGFFVLWKVNLINKEELCNSFPISCRRRIWRSKNFFLLFFDLCPGNGGSNPEFPVAATTEQHLVVLIGRSRSTTNGELGNPRTKQPIEWKPLNLAVLSLFSFEYSFVTYGFVLRAWGTHEAPVETTFVGLSAIYQSWKSKFENLLGTCCSNFVLLFELSWPMHICGQEPWTWTFH